MQPEGSLPHSQETPVLILSQINPVHASPVVVFRPVGMFVRGMLNKFDPSSI
jgi:hypothetical protein